MGKSPGKWMKTLLFGKKKSRSKNHKPVDNEETQVQKVPLPVSLDQRTEAKTEENQLPDNPQDEACMTTELNAQTDSDRIREEQAAIHLQAAFRGYAARRTLRSLIGIIRLQALIRGHLVRRQAVSTLHCMFQIVKFQALVRGRKIRNSSIGIQVGTRFNPVNRLVMCSVGFSTSMQILKQSSNGFARKLHSSSSTSMHLHFHYNSHEPNSVSSWLARWSASRCWQRLPNPKPDQPSEPLNPHTPRSSATNAEKISSKFDKPIKNLKKVSSTEPVNCAEESPELVLQRVKSNLRKVNNPVIQSRNDSVQKIITKPEKLSDKEDGNGAVSDTVKQVFMERKEAVQIKRRSVPGYMAATVSAKAKVRGQDGSEKYLDDALNRRHSMSSLSSASVSVSSMVKSAGKLKNDRSLQLSRDGNVKVNQTEWRR